MFTGLIEEVGLISAVETLPTGKRFRINCKEILADMRIGDSISVCGGCQTVEEFSDNGFSIFSIPETLAVTNFNDFGNGTRVNLERALRMGDRLGGHIVQGHVEGKAKILEIRKAEALDIFMEYASPYIISKGSVCLDGISLTVMEKVDLKTFRVQIIPETIRKTNIGDWKAGMHVNVEVDYIIKSLDQARKNEARLLEAAHAAQAR
jgi:riboflavin synthase